jgi:hypothetical protein
MYKSLIRPVLEYATEIWGDASVTNKVKLDSIQHRSITSALGVNRLAHRRDTNYEARILPLEFRRKEKIFKYWKRLKDNSGTKEYISKLKRPDRLINDRRKSFFERILALKNEFQKKDIDIDKIDFKTFHRQIVSKWIQSLRNSKTEEDRQKGMSYQDLQKLKYRRFSQERKENSVWHQARLGVLPLKAFLFEIKKAKDSTCRKCKTKETVDHFLSECNKHTTKWKNSRVKRKNPNVCLGLFLNPDRPPPEKILIAKTILSCLKNPIYNRKYLKLI